MATLAFSLAGQVVGGMLGGPFGALAGRALGALAGSALDNALFGETPEGRTPPEFRLQGSIEGGPIPRLYGWSRLTGNIIWATQLEQIDAESTGGKGGLPGGDEDAPAVVASFAVALCEGEVHRLGRIWADGQLLETEGLTIRFYRGTADQGIDSLIEATQGTGSAPAYRGLCYLVFERLPIAPFGNRIPNLAVEVCRVVGELEPAITAITVIPGATEFGYDPTPRVRILGPGITANENTHLSARVSDWTLSLDELQALCPNLKHVALVVSWFGDDLRCGHCTIAPRVENATRVVDGVDWSAAGLSRGTAGVVSTYDGGPAYGGTPSDGAVRAAIADLKARGLAVTLYPLIMMDVALGNTLPNPYGGTGQPAYPWRGRITCTPAPGVTGSPDQSAAVTPQVEAFVGTAGGWGYRRMLRHYAQLAVSAGGVDALVLGSEMRGVSFLRDGGNGFPFVDALATLAGEVRTIVGPGTKLTYGADWSEFTGLQPANAPGDKFFHLDALWASPDIDAVGIDNYMPLADWRDGSGHSDAAIADDPYGTAYLSANIAGGEGYDWYYASDADRIAAERTPILDGAHGEPWVWRYKDLAGWWAHAHHNRVGGVRQPVATAWVPQSKPIWFTELGCAATDKGANQPNVFGDAKSSEDARPYFSSSAPDGLAQRQFLRAHFGWWRPEAPGFNDARNPVSATYGGRMLDSERIYLWTWDARPYPAFPAEAESWSDAVNHANGHWLTGRLGAAASDEIAVAIAGDYGVDIEIVRPAAPLLHGMVVEGVVSCRDALAPVLGATGLSVRETDAGLGIDRARPRLASPVEADNRARGEGPLTARRRPEAAAAVNQLGLSFGDRERDYLTGTATALRPGNGVAVAEHTPLVLDIAGARLAAERRLADARAGETLELALPLSRLALATGDVIAVEGSAEPFEVTEIRDAAVRRITARVIAADVTPAIHSGRAAAAGVAVTPRALPQIIVAQLPPRSDAPTGSRLLIAVSSVPWPGDIVIRHGGTGSEAARVTRPAWTGALAEALAPGPVMYWDERNEIELVLQAGHLASVEPETVLAGANRVAVETDAGQWEVIGFAHAELIAPGTYRLSRLLRGQAGTEHAVGPAAAGRRVVVLDQRVAEVNVPVEWLGETLGFKALAGPTDVLGQAVSVALAVDAALPLSPAHPAAVRDGATGDIAISWTRRSRADGNGWGLSEAPLEHAPEAYRVSILLGGTPVRTMAADAPGASYSAADQLADFGVLPPSFAFTISQVSPVLGPGHPAQGAFHA